MKKKFLIAIAALMMFGLVIGVYAFQTNQTTNAKASCCAMADCCKDGHCKMGRSCCDGSCPIKDKDKTDTTSTVNMSKVAVVGGDGDSCSKPGADCCKGGSCCHGKNKG